MSEAIGMAGMIETPVVIVNVQRGGPSTGLPTKSEQGDLNQVFGASHGDYPRVIIAPRDATDCLHATVEALNLAETFQLPVTLISDLLLGEHRSTIDPEAISSDVKIAMTASTSGSSMPTHNGSRTSASLVRSVTSRPSTTRPYRRPAGEVCSGT